MLSFARGYRKNEEDVADQEQAAVGRHLRVEYACRGELTNPSAPWETEDVRLGQGYYSENIYRWS